jgi:hypothetical protein
MYRLREIHHLQLQSKKESTMEIRDYERTAYEAKLDVTYSIMLHRLTENFYKKIETAFAFLSVLSGAAILTATFGESAKFITIFAFIAACTGILTIVIRPAEKYALHEVWRNKFTDLNVLIERKKIVNLEDIDSELRALQGQSPSAICALETIAYNRNLTSHGRPDFRISENLWNKAFGLLA